MRDSVESLRVDNTLFSKNNGKFLRKLLHIAGQKKERWWYVARVMNDDVTKDTLDKTAPRDEVQFYESIVKRVGVSQEELAARHKVAAAIDATAGNDSDSDDIVSDDGSHDFDEQALAALHRQDSMPARAATASPHLRRQFAGAPTRMRPSTACSQRGVHRTHGMQSLDPACRVPPRPQSAMAGPTQPTPEPLHVPRQEPYARPASAQSTRAPRKRPATAMGHSSVRHVGVRRPQSALAAPKEERKVWSHDVMHRHKTRPSFSRRPSDIDLIKKEPKAVQMAAGVPIRDEPEATAGQCWTRTNGVVKRVREIVDSVEVFISGGEGDRYEKEELEIDEKWALQDVGRVPDHDEVTCSPPPSSGESVSSDSDAQQRKRDRQQHRYDAKLEQKLAAKRQKGLPPDAQLTDTTAESPLVIAPTPLKKINGKPATVHEDYTMRLERRDSLNGGSNMFTDGSLASELRSARWRPCLEVLNSVEQAIFKLEKCWADRRKAEEDVDHPPVVSEKDKEAVLRQGMDCEGDEVSALLTKWAADMEQRLKVLIMYEMINTQQAVAEVSTETAGTQTDETMPTQLAQRRSVTDTSRIQRRPSAALTRDQSRQSQAFVSMRSHTESIVGFSALAHAGFITRSQAFAHSVYRVAAAMRMQSIYRGYRDRTLVGNVKKGVLTFFHSRDKRVREAWLKGAKEQLQAPNPENTRGLGWLSSTVNTLLNSKITSNYLCDSQKKPRVDFINFMFEHFTESYQEQAVVESTVGSLLVLLDKHVDHDLIYAIVCNFLFCIWNSAHANLLAQAMCCTHSIVNKLGDINYINPHCATDVDVYLSSAQTKQIIRQVFPASKGKAPHVHEEIIRKCKTLETLKGQGVAGATGTARAPQAASPGRGKKGETSKGVTVTQKELFFAILLVATPDMLLEFGFAS